MATTLPMAGEKAAPVMWPMVLPAVSRTELPGSGMARPPSAQRSRATRSRGILSAALSFEGWHKCSKFTYPGVERWGTISLPTATQPRSKRRLSRVALPQG